MSKARDFGIQSFCFRTVKDNLQIAKYVKEIGLDKIEVCAVHADFHNLSQWKEIVETYRSEGVSIVSIGVETLVGDANERDLFECAAAAGAKHISVHFQIDTFPKAIEQAKALCDEYGIRLGIHCHGGYMFGGSPDVLTHLLDLGGPQVGLNIDTAWCMQIGPKRGNPIEWAKTFAGKVYGVHYKDFTFGTDGAWSDVVVGQGNLDLPGFISALEDNGFDGMAVIEYEGDPENPVQSLKRCVDAMRSA
ncbi:MAG: sugar phosphate isomerase/epimerase [Verrucomicrobiota bacterium]